MTRITLDVKDNKLPFFMELLNNFDFINVKRKDKAKINTKEEDEPTKEEILANIRQGLKEVHLIEQGKMKSRPAKEFLNEL